MEKSIPTFTSFKQGFTPFLPTDESGGFLAYCCDFLDKKQTLCVSYNIQSKKHLNDVNGKRKVRKMSYSLNQAFKQRDYAVNDYFEIRENDQLILADPCYEEGLKDLVEHQASSTATVVANPYGVICAKLKPGTYRIEFNHEENGRMKSWTFKHQSTYYYATSMSYNIPVDSGQVGLFLKESLYQDQPLPEDTIQTLAKEMNWQEHHPWYVYMSATSLKYLNLNAFGICTGTW